jgi:hypothetical protein
MSYFIRAAGARGRPMIHRPAPPELRAHCRALLRDDAAADVKQTQIGDWLPRWEPQKATISMHAGEPTTL